MHGIIMIFFFLIPSIPAVLGNFLVPMMIGARDLAFPRLNLLSWYIYMIGGAVHPLGDGHRRRRHRLDLLHALQHARTRTPTSSPRRSASSSPASRRSSPGSTSSSPSTRCARPGLTWFRLPLFVWAHYATSMIMVLGTPVLAITHAAGRRSSAPSTSASSTRRSAATRCCSSTCSGSTRTRPSTS